MGREETRLFVNDAPILTASNDGIRLAQYADEVEQLEAVAARLAQSLGVRVEFARVGRADAWGRQWDTRSQFAAGAGPGAAAAH